MQYNEIDYNELVKEIVEKKSALLCGNGFSINFDTDYKLRNLVGRLYRTHCHLNLNEFYDIVSNVTYKTALRENYLATKKILKRINNETAFVSLFSNAVTFAQLI